MKAVIAQFVDHVQGDKDEARDSNDEATQVQHHVSALLSHIADGVDEEVF